MKSEYKVDSMKRALSVLSIYVLLAASGGALLQAQEEGAAAEPSTLGVLMEPTSEGNTFQATQAIYHQGVRDLKRAVKLAEKAAQTDDSEKAADLLARSEQANGSAIQLITQALQQNPKLLEGYEDLGFAYRRAGKYQEAMQIHAMGLGKDPGNLENYRGWSESVLALNMLGDATTAYARMVETGSPGAPILMDEIKEWLAAKQADPGDLDPAHVERLAQWVADQSG